MEDGQYGKLKVGAVIQARMDSTRLPHKVLMNLPINSSETVLSRICNSLNTSKAIDEVIVATSNDKNDDEIEDFTTNNSIYIVRGSKENVLSRYVKAIDERQLDIVLRFTGDNPIVLTDLINKSIHHFVKHDLDYVTYSNLPIGTNFEIVKSKVLKEVNSFNNLIMEHQEHVTLYIKQHPENFKIGMLIHDLPEIKCRFTIDYPSDYAVLNIIFQHKQFNDNRYTYLDLYKLVTKNRWISDINKNSYQKNPNLTIEEEIVEAKKILKHHGLKNALERI